MPLISVSAKEYETIKKSLQSYVLCEIDSCGFNKKHTQRDLLMYKFGDLQTYYEYAETIRYEDVQKAVELYTYAAERGHVKAMSSLGYKYFHMQIYDKAFIWFNNHITSNADDKTRSYYYLGNMYRDGLGVEKNLKKMVYFYDLAFKKYLNAFEELVRIYYEYEEYDKVLNYMKEYQKNYPNNFFDKYPIMKKKLFHF